MMKGSRQQHSETRLDVSAETGGEVRVRVEESDSTAAVAINAVSTLLSRQYRSNARKINTNQAPHQAMVDSAERAVGGAKAAADEGTSCSMEALAGALVELVGGVRRSFAIASPGGETAVGDWAGGDCLATAAAGAACLPPGDTLAAAAVAGAEVTGAVDGAEDRTDAAGGAGEAEEALGDEADGGVAE